MLYYDILLYLRVRHRCATAKVRAADPKGLPVRRPHRVAEEGHDRRRDEGLAGPALPRPLIKMIIIIITMIIIIIIMIIIMIITVIVFNCSYELTVLS